MTTTMKWILSVTVAGIVALGLGAGVVRAQFVPDVEKYREDQQKRDEERQKQDAERKKAEDAKRKEEEAQKREEEAKQKRLSAELARSRIGKSQVTKVETKKVGDNEFTAATVTRAGGEWVALIPQYQEGRGADARWVSDENLIKAVRELQRSGDWETVNTEEYLGLRWVVGVGENSPKTVADWMRARTGQDVASATSSSTGSTQESSGTSDDTEATTSSGTAVGRFVRLTEQTLDGKRVTGIVIERGAQLTLTTFWLASKSSNGTIKAASRGDLKAAEELSRGAQLRIDYERIDGEYFVKGYKSE